MFANIVNSNLKNNLDKDEWGIVNYAIENYKWTYITGIDKMFFRNIKGKTVFGIYSTNNIPSDDGEEYKSVLLYAVHGNKAKKAYNLIKTIMEGNEHGRNILSGTDSFASGINDAWLRQVYAIINNGKLRQSGSGNGNASVHSKKSGIYADAALRNVLENIFEERQSDGEIKNRDRLDSAAENRIIILENYIKNHKKSGIYTRFFYTIYPCISNIIAP